MNDRQIAIKAAQMLQDYRDEQKKLHGPNWNLCGCSGSDEGEPFCRCVMNDFERMIKFARQVMIQEYNKGDTILYAGFAMNFEQIQEMNMLLNRMRELLAGSNFVATAKGKMFDIQPISA